MKYQNIPVKKNNRTNRKEASQNLCKQLNQTKSKFLTIWTVSERLVSSETAL
jgi:hypothetical protein